MKTRSRLTLLVAAASMTCAIQAAGPAWAQTQAQTQAQAQAQANTVDPAWFRTPEPQGTGARTIPVRSGQSLQDALNRAKPGDVVEIHEGVHKASRGFVILNSGTPSQWITVRAAAGATPTLDLNNTGSFQITASNIVVEGLEIVNGLGDNIHISPWQGSIRNIIVRGMKIHSLKTGAGAAIKINRNNQIRADVENVYIEDSDLQQPINNAVVDGVGVRTAVVRNNWIHNPTQGNSGIFFKGGSSQVLIEGNLISGIRGNSALMLGGNSGGQYFDPDFASQEGVDQIARNNIIADYDDSAIEVRGVVRGAIYHNTIVGASPYTAFRLTYGNNAAGGRSGNQQITISDNLVIHTAPTPMMYAWNDGNVGSFSVGPQLWAGLFKQYERNGLPTFPQKFDVPVSRYDVANIVRNPSYEGLAGLDDARSRYALTARSPALGNASGLTRTLFDAVGEARAKMPSLGALE
ncbi:hypothetical protein IGS68_02460 [Skermanella sp. TT6]|uniref:Right handed beta helix domain-containing protein n=1 Tax=Skermanella cutis TaxID=2775420 RepID=A0ABX7BCJ1_9PROT|nr:hypothetical protein [Skermanella sp. TT6]QQP90152.1 hypothetical protein IGS68_02460 [Skermanella sp. TT6]